MTDDKCLDNLKSLRDNLDLDFSRIINKLKHLPMDPNNNYDTIYDDSVVNMIDKLKDLVIQIKNIDSIIDTSYKSKLNI